jgi:two-component system, OmpR family, sensor kinase
MRLPIRIRMTAWYAALLVAVLVATGTFLVVRLRADLTADMDRALRPAAARVAADYRAEGAPELRDAAEKLPGGERFVTQVLDPSGRVIAWAGDPAARTPIPGRPGFRSAAHPAGADTVVVGESTAPIDRSVDRLLALLGLAVPAAVLATVAGGWLLARRALRPVDGMTRTAAAIGADDLQTRIDVPASRDEVARLAATLNTMLARIEGGVQAQRRLVADASHELRTPLAAMRAELDVSLEVDDLDPPARAALESTRDEVDRLSRTVEDLLSLAAADEGAARPPATPADLRELAAGLGAEVTGEPAPVLGDPMRLRHAIRNLVANAADFGTTVEVRTWARGSEAGVTVTDDGPGIPPELRERVFERFFRVDPARARATGGSGLGLAIVREVAAAHGGRAWIEAREPHGTAASLALPVRRGDRPPPLQAAGAAASPPTRRE